jgi:CCR4-NOT transcription complex subunit 9
MANSNTFGYNVQPDYDWRQHGNMPSQHASAPPASSHPGHAHQPHFNRMAAMSNASATSASGGMPPISNGELQPSLLANTDPQTAEENRRTLEWIGQLLNQSTRETALLELSKKREQVPELALVLWHSFGTSLSTHLSLSRQAALLSCSDPILQA